jgi:hypothetical protein
VFRLLRWGSGVFLERRVPEHATSPESQPYPGSAERPLEAPGFVQNGEPVVRTDGSGLPSNHTRLLRAS